MKTARGLDGRPDRFAAAVFYVLNVLLFPVTLIGYVIWVGKALLAGRGSGVSSTAQGPLSARFFQHKLGIREDDPARSTDDGAAGRPACGSATVRRRLCCWPTE